MPEAHITIYASKFGSDVTTHGAAGVWMPYKLSETPEALTDRWASSSSGVTLMPHSNLLFLDVPCIAPACHLPLPNSP